MTLHLGHIEQGIKDTLIKHMNQHMPLIQEIKSYSGELVSQEHTLKAVPKIWVSFKESKTSRQLNANKVEYSVVFTVCVVANQTMTKNTDYGQAFLGSYEILNEVQYVLLKNDLSGVGIQGLTPLSLGETNTLMNTKIGCTGLSVITQDFLTKYVIDSNTKKVPENDAEIVDSNIRFPNIPKETSTSVDNRESVPSTPEVILKRKPVPKYKEDSSSVEGDRAVFPSKPLDLLGKKPDEMLELTLEREQELRNKRLDKEERMLEETSSESKL